MMSKKMREASGEGSELFVKLRAEVIQRLRDTGLSKYQAKKTWHNIVRTEYFRTAESLKTRHIVDLSEDLIPIKDDG